MKKLCLIFVLATLPFFETLAEVVIGDYKYDLNTAAKTATILGSASYTVYNVIIPETIQFEGVEYTVTEIGENAFPSAASVSFPKTIAKIGKDAFSNHGTEVIYITDLEAWCKIVFENPGSLPYYYNAKVPSVIRVYLNGEQIKDLVIPEGVTSISAGAFSHWAVRDLTIPSSLKSVGESALSVVNVNYDRQEGSLHISDLSAWLDIQFANEYSNPIKEYKHLYLNNEIITDLKIPDGTKAIHDYAFINCQSIKSVTIPRSVTNIGSKAFAECTNIKTVDCFPEVIPETAEDAFGNIYDAPLLLSTLYVPEEAMETYRTHEPWNAFMSLVPFGGEPEATEFEENGIRYMSYNMKSISARLIGGKVASADGKLDISTVVHEGKTYKIVEVGAYALMNSETLTALSFGYSVRVIGPQAFRGCRNLKEVDHLPNNLELLGDSAFMDCINMNLHPLPQYYDYDIKYFPESLIQQESPYSGAGAFSGCKDLLNYPPNSNYLLNQLLAWTEIPERMFYGISSMTGRLNIPLSSNIKRLRKEAFSGNRFQGVTLSEGLEAIEEKALFGIRATSIKLPSTIKELGYLAISNDPDDDLSGPCPLKEITCLAAEPPVNDPKGAFNADVYETAELIVPEESVELYMAAPDWRRFRTINGKVNTRIAGIETYTNENTPIYDLQGRRLTGKPGKGLYIQNGRKVMVK